MNDSQDRDQSVERLLRQSFKAPPRGVTDACLDAETIAAWIDGGLSGAGLELARSHVAECARCRAIVGGVVRTGAILPQPQPARRPWLTWLVPATAAAAAVALWIAVPREPDSLAPPATVVARQSPEVVPSGPAALESERPSAATPKEAQASEAKSDLPNGAQRQATELRKDAGRPALDQLKPHAQSTGDLAAAAPAEKAAGMPAAAPPPSTPPAREAFADRSANTLARAATPGAVIVSPDAAIRWRITGSLLEQSTNGGADWQAVSTGVTTELIAGVAPATSVCWVVGRGGVVLRSTDGRSFSRLPFPEITDLAAIRAPDARSATVTTVDGRTFETIDGGIIWQRQ